MILYNLCCKDCTHEFEAWFRNSEGYETLAKSGEIACAQCGGSNVEKGIMAPRLNQASSEKVARKDSKKAVMLASKAKKAMQQLRQKVEENCDYVGDQFAEEARRIHYGESDERGIYGDATEQEHETLTNEGIDVHRIPWIDRTEH